MNKTLLKKILCDDLCDKLQNYGYEFVTKELLFYKNDANSIYKIISFEFSKGGHLKIFAFCWVSEVQLRGYDMSDFPKDIFMVTKNRIGTKGFDKGESLWACENEKECRESLREFTRILDEEIIPWFNSVVTREDFVDAIQPRLKEEEYFDAMKADILNNN